MCMNTQILLKRELGLLYRYKNITNLLCQTLLVVYLISILSSYFLNLFGVVKFSTSQSPLLLKWPRHSFGQSDLSKVCQVRLLGEV